MGDLMHDIFNALFLLPEVDDAIAINEAFQVFWIENSS